MQFSILSFLEKKIWFCLCELVEFRKQISYSLQLSNNTDTYVALKVSFLPIVLILFPI